MDGSDNGQRIEVGGLGVTWEVGATELVMEGKLGRGRRPVSS